MLGEYRDANLYVLDSKGDEDAFAGWPGLVVSADPPSPADVEGRVQVWRPPDDDPGAYEDWLRGLLKARLPAIILVDELSSLAEGGERNPKYPGSLTRILKQGRSLHIQPIILSQEGQGIPRMVKAAKHFVYFRLGAENWYSIAQAARMLGQMPPKRGAPGPLPAGRYGFFYRSMLPARGATREFHDAAEFFGL